MDQYSSIIYLNVNTILKIHDNEMDHTGGVKGVRNLHGLESATEQPRASFDGKELYPNIFLKAAVLAYGIAEGQVFVDGNKRVALVSALTFLDINGYLINEDESLYDLMIGLSNKSVSKEDLGNELQKRAVKLLL